jgi:uncharacterized protein YecT (DUF1311 family)
MRQSILALATMAAGICLAAGCSSSSSTQSASASPASASPASSAPGTAVPTAGGTAPASGGTAASGAAGSTTRFIPITEHFDPGHPAEAKSAPASCGSESSTLTIEQCYENKTETTDAKIDTVQQAAFARASSAGQAAINRADTAWLLARPTVCSKAYVSGGTIDEINIAACLLDESTAWLSAVHNMTPAEAVLKSTDSTSADDMSWYTTPEGSRISMSDTQGDATGGAIIAWVIIAGAGNFVVNPAQFTYQDGKFTDAGTAVGASAKGHVVQAGTVYQFSLDYSKLSSDPGKGKNGGWVYTTTQPAAVWR